MAKVNTEVFINSELCIGHVFKPLRSHQLKVNAVRFEHSTANETFDGRNMGPVCIVHY